MLQTIFNVVLTQSITGGFLVLVILGLKPLIHRRWNAVWQYYLWGVVLLWLMSPFIPDIPLLNHLAIPKIQKDLLPMTSIDITSGLTNPINPINVTVPHTHNVVSLGGLIPWFWLIGAIFFAIHNGYRYVQFNLNLRRSSFCLSNPTIKVLLDACREDMGIKRNVCLRGSYSIGSPILSGFINPVVILPDMDFEVEEYKLIFIHELIHYKRKDVLYKMIALLANTVHWFNPLIYLAVKNIHEACEYACDEAVVQNMAESERKSYGEIILNLITIQTDKNIALSTALSGIRKIERRLNLIMKPRKFKKSILVVVVVVATLLTITGVFASSYTGKLLGKDAKQNGASSTQNTGDKELYAFLLDLDKTMAVALEIDLNNFRKVDTLDGFTKPEYDELRLLDVKMQIPSKYGDSILSIYLNEDNTKGVALKQGIAQTKEFKGVYNMYLFEPNSDKGNKFVWKITGTKSVEGEFKAINETVKEHFMKNQTPKNELQQPTSNENTSTSQITTGKYETIQQAHP